MSYEQTLVASGLVDDVADIIILDPKPHRYSEGDYICRRGEEAECLWIIVSGSVSVRENDRTLFVRGRNEVVGEQNLLGNGFRRLYDLVASESQVELLEIDKAKVESHPQAHTLWRNIAKIISLKLKDSTIKTSSLTRQLQDDTRILKAYMNEYALSRCLQSGAGHITDYKVDRAIVWFSDVVDFSRHVLELAPSRTADIVQRFFNAQSIPITGHGGHIDKFIGDGLMAFWVLSDNKTVGVKCLEALRAAEEAVKSVSEIRIGNSPLHLRIGLHVGLVLSGDFGSVARHQFTLIGREVNKAARLEQVHPEDVIEGDRDLGAIRLSVAFKSELTDTVKRRYRRYSKAQAKNIGELEIYS
ncbi:MAG: cyclic nucleotide-binding domain-containing protein [Alphaproteobacteria bacterium]|nr:cyclic nucleotide-binding domain-containing protein [Alphaproteobacteria bacterium]